MLKTKLLFPVLTLLVFFSLKTFAQDEMAPPKPVDNKVYEAMCGTWTGESEMMGMKMQQEVNIHWALDHQFIFMELKATSTDKPDIQYSGLGVFGVDKEGKSKGWWFDNWGASAMSSGEGTFEGNKLIFNDANEMFSETRTFEVNGDEMIMSAKGNYKMNGHEMPFEEKAVYKKK
jgi:hypothetical protein